MCMNPMKVLPYAVGGLVGGSILSRMAKKNSQQPLASPAAIAGT